jgi:hypothetical protein
MILKDTNCGEPLGGLLRLPKPLAGIIGHRAFSDREWSAYLARNIGIAIFYSIKSSVIRAL